ncbi:MAG TPA: glycosyltransferase [Thermoanaerobaculia bacterium]
MTSTTRPAVSVVIPAYESQRTLAGCLEAISRQTFQDFETVVVDSSPGEAAESTRRIVEGFTAVRFERSEQRLLPHAARNLGVARSRGELLAFTDPDVYARPDWLERLVAAHRATGEPVVGALACHGGRWLDQGVHLCKFSKWLPGGPPREVDMSPTANMLLPRRQFEAAGGFPGDQFLGDVTLSRSLRRQGHRLGFEPRAVVAHHHLHTLGSFVAERYTRGRMYGHLRLDGTGAGRGAALGWLAVTLPPVRLARILALVGLHASRAGQTGRCLATLPLVAVGHAASLAGEAAAYFQRLRFP